ncbi:TIGR03621 family F420-dependent LLM class oxidoreductase [Kutzneria sp. CA-103260]|uniref:TIGR03621 family F420-dependent LLM class oxidoreductase n=1 Tax=Kutzneria sp. CA-103260 TaxID=2802641 RepID=UPI001BA51134|nr:TIGR03621 family F420-dependent LLM class oxidoreductase [Kutzneria sp. CA-103260]QUQ70592.1 oxidoreductase [Kutzneria sp. CA-103260]
MGAFRFGVLAETAGSVEEVAATARRAEELGYDTVLLRDHFVPEPFGDQVAPLIGLAAAAAATSRLRVGTLVLDNDYRHPVMLAKEAATLQQLSGGRFELGLGAGWLRVEYEAAGMAFDRAGVRVGRLEESVRLVKELFAGKEVRFEGEHYRIDGVTNYPAVDLAPAVLIGAGSPRMLRLAGREADTVGILAKTLPGGTISDAMEERLSSAFATKADLVRAEGRNVEISSVVSVDLADDPRAAAERYAVERGWGAGAADLVEDMPAKFLGPLDHIVELAHRRRECLGLSYLVVSDRELEAAAPLVRALSGR